jgi:predicted phosphodiesterase
MPVGKERVTEVIDYALTHGDTRASEVYGLPISTLERYRRKYKEIYGEGALIYLALKKRFTDSELKGIISSSRITPVTKQVPDVSYAGETITFGVLADTHIGSIDTDPQDILSAFREFQTENCSFVVHAGDVVEGMMNRPSHVYELSSIGYKAQRDEAIRIFKQCPLPMYVINGNHDESFNTKIGMGVDIVEEVCNAVGNLRYLGTNDGSIVVNDIKITLFHGTDAGASAALSHRGQRILDSIPISDRPSILITAHDHKAISFKYKGSYVVAGGCIQKQTGFMRGRRMDAYTGFWIIKMTVRNGRILKFQPTFYTLGEDIHYED